MQWSPEDVALLASGFWFDYSLPGKREFVLYPTDCGNKDYGHAFVIVWWTQSMIASICSWPILQLRVRRFLESGWDEARSSHYFSILLLVKWLGITTFRCDIIYIYTMVYTIRIMAFQSFAISVAEFHGRLRLWDVAHEGLWWAFVEAAEQVRTKGIVTRGWAEGWFWQEWAEINYDTFMYL